MDFFARQEAARKHTTRLVVLFGAAVAGIILAVYSVLAVYLYGRGPRGGAPPGFWHPDVFAAVAVGVLAVVAFGSLFKIAALRGGGQVVAESLGGRRVATDTTVFEERRLLNVVEEMALASGVPVPPVYVLNDQNSINAFAAGYTPDDAVVAVTRGAMLGLDRDELQGVIAHEFSHILNGDMRLNIRLMGVLFGILVLALIGRSILRFTRFQGRGRSGKGGGAIAAVLAAGLTLFVVGYIGVFFGKLIKSAVSRQREFLADASAVQFTRDPGGIAGALKKIGGLALGAKIDHPRAEEASHMFFGNGLKNRSSGLFSTHPPLAKRVKRIDPGFDGTFAPFELPAPATAEGPAETPEGKKKTGIPEGLDRLTGSLLVAVAADPQVLLRRIGRPMLEHTKTVRRMLDEIPEELLETAHEPYGARAVIYALLLDGRPSEREAQLRSLEEQADPAVFELVDRIRPMVDGLPPLLRIPLADVAVYALRSLTPSQYETFRRNVDVLIRTDMRVDDFEFTMQRLLIRHVDEFFHPVDRDKVLVRSLGQVGPEVACVLSALARAGQDGDEAAAVSAFEQAAASLGGGFDESMLPPEQCRVEDLDRALDRLATASPAVKRRLVSACLVSLVQDGEIRLREALLFRAVSDALRIPVPPALDVVPTPNGNAP